MRAFAIVDVWCGLGFAALGGWAMVTALDFDASSSTYPAILAALLLGLSLTLVAQTLRAAAPKRADIEGTHVLIQGPGIEIAAWSAWAAGLALGAGYLIASFAAMAVLIMRHAAAPRPRHHLAQATAVAAGAFAMFDLVFHVPLPELEAIRDLFGL